MLPDSLQKYVSLQAWFTAAPEVASHSLMHEHGNHSGQSGHDHKIDMQHPILALNMVILSIAVKEGYLFNPRLAPLP